MPTKVGKVKREKGYLYYVTGNGDVMRAPLARKTKKAKAAKKAKKAKS